MALTKGQRHNAFRRMNGRCAYCGCKLNENNFHVDHFVAKANGGKAHENLVASCPDCNISKGKLSVEQFRSEIENLDKTILGSMKGRMLTKYFIVKREPVVFYFEKIGAEKWLTNECSQ